MLWLIFLRNYKFLGVPFNENSPISPISIKMYKNDINIELSLDKPQKSDSIFGVFLYLIKSTKLLPSPKTPILLAKKSKIDPSSWRVPSTSPTSRPLPLSKVQPFQTTKRGKAYGFLPSQGLTWNLKMAQYENSCWINMVHLKMTPCK